MNRLCWIYLSFCLIGIVLPYSQILPWSMQNGWNIQQFINDLRANQISLFAWADVSVSAFVFLIFQEIERRRLKMPPSWIPIISLFLVGLSLAFPLFLLLRERHLIVKSEVR
ncbi:MAG: DUF2834 domain-containing protein [Verrucomicrobiota bacterium]